MAQTKKKRRRKHRGTQGGGIDRRRSGRPATAERGPQRRLGARPPSRRDIKPTWRSATNRALIAAAVFFGLLVLLFGQPLVQALALAAFMLVFYIPMGYGIDTFFYNRRRQKMQRATSRRASEQG